MHYYGCSTPFTFPPLSITVIRWIYKFCDSIAITAELTSSFSVYQDLRDPSELITWGPDVQLVGRAFPPAQHLYGGVSHSLSGSCGGSSDAEAMP